MNLISALLAFVIFSGMCSVMGLPVVLAVVASVFVGVTVGK